VFCIPAQCLEAWVFASLHSDEAMKYADFECRRDPESLLIGKPTRLVSGNSHKKITANYKMHVKTIAEGWPSTTGLCGEARRFENEFFLACS
jgi:hypothetical protein